MTGGSFLRLLVLAGFIVVVAVALWLADVDRPLVVLGIALAWAIAAVYEWVSWRPPRGRWPRPDQAVLDRGPPPRRGPARAPWSRGVERRAPGPASSSKRRRVRTLASGRGGREDAARAETATAEADSAVNEDGGPKRRRRGRRLRSLLRREHRKPAGGRDPTPGEPRHGDEEMEPTPAAPDDGPPAPPEPPDTVAEDRLEPRRSPPAEPASAPPDEVEKREAPSDGQPERRELGAGERAEAPAPREAEGARVAEKLAMSAPSSPARRGAAAARAAGASLQPVTTASRPEEERAVARPQPATPTPPGTPVASLPEPSSEPREWNVWELERLAREESAQAPTRGEEWSYLFLYLRQFAQPGGSLPVEFDGLVRESFVELLDRVEPA